MPFMLCNATVLGRPCAGRGCEVCAHTGLMRCDRHFNRPATVRDRDGAWCSECAEVRR